jgi:hypothetical protein
MTRKGLAIAVIAAILFLVSGCGREESDERLIELAVKVKKQQQALERLTGVIQALEKRLEQIEKSYENGSGSPGSTETAIEETPAPPETTRPLSGILEQLNLTPSLFAGARQSITEYAERLMEGAASWRAMGEPDEVSQKLDILVANFSAKVGNPTLAERLAGDVEWLKRKYLAPLTAEEQRDLARTITVEAIGMMSHDEQSRQWLEAQLRALEQSTNPAEVAARVNVTLELRRAWEVRELARAHNVPEEMMEECGLTLSPEATQYIPTQMMEGLGLTPSP